MPTSIAELDDTLLAGPHLLCRLIASIASVCLFQEGPWVAVTARLSNIHPSAVPAVVLGRRALNTDKIPPPPALTFYALVLLKWIVAESQSVMHRALLDFLESLLSYLFGDVSFVTFSTQTNTTLFVEVLARVKWAFHALLSN